MAGAMLPDFRLTDGRGDAWSPEGLRQQQEMLFALLGDEGATQAFELLRALAREARSVGLGGAATVALGDVGAAARTPELELPFPLLEDPELRVQRAIAAAAGLSPGAVALVAADRYGEVQFAKPLAGGDADQIVREALDQIDFVQQQCPE